MNIFFLEPGTAEKRARLSERIVMEKKKSFSIEETKSRLKEIRQSSIRDIGLRPRLRGIKTIYAKNSVAAARYIHNNSDNLRRVVINKSAIVHELLPQLASFEIIDTYTEQLRLQPDMLKKNYWELPELSEELLWSSFVLSHANNVTYPKIDYSCTLGIVGVNCVSLNPPSIFIVQHFQNITDILAQAEKVFFVAGIDRIVRTGDDALFQTRCCAFFGTENILISTFSSQRGDTTAGNFLARSSNVHAFRSAAKELHLILLDNGRKKLARTEYKELLYCIGCNSCAAFCPRERNEKYSTWSPRELLMSAFLFGLKYAVEEGLYNCTVCEHCKKCCPLEINIPKFMLRLRERATKANHLPQSHTRVRLNIEQFGNPYGK